MRKSRVEGKPSLLPKPRRPGSTERLSSDNPRPSIASYRSSSAEPARVTFAPGRLSREASATKIPLNGRSRSQTLDIRYGQSNPSMTPLRSSHYSRSTTTPMKTPSEDRTNRSWQTSLERALAFLTVKDQRPVSNVAWQRAEYARVSELLAARGEPGAMSFIRPLTIAKFVDIAGALLAAVNSDAKINNDNYVTKLPHLAKRLLYPGAVSKSWLRTVNTLHAFPHALALIGYLLDMAMHIETPVQEESLYVDKEPLAALRRDFQRKCWIRFQDPGHQFNDLIEEYDHQLQKIYGNHDEKIEQLQQVIKKLEASVEDAVEAEARAEGARRAAWRDELKAGVHSVNAARRHIDAELRAHEALRAQRDHQLQQLDADVERASVELERLRGEVERQAMSVAERVRLLDEVDYLVRVNDSKRELLDKISKMVLSKETELALWQKKTLDCCVEYNRGLIHLAAPFPRLAHLAVDEKVLMEAECAERLARAVEVLREEAAQLAARRADAARTRTALCRKQTVQLEESRAKIAELKLAIQREQQALEGELAKEAAEAAAWASEELGINARLEELRAQQEAYARVDADGDFWEKQDLAWRTKLSELRDYIAAQRDEARCVLADGRQRRVTLLLDSIRLWHEKITQMPPNGSPSHGVNQA